MSVLYGILTWTDSVLCCVSNIWPAEHAIQPIELLVGYWKLGHGWEEVGLAVESKAHEPCWTYASLAGGQVRVVPILPCSTPCHLACQYLALLCLASHHHSWAPPAVSRPASRSTTATDFTDLAQEEPHSLDPTPDPG